MVRVAYGVITAQKVKAHARDGSARVCFALHQYYLYMLLLSGNLAVADLVSRTPSKQLGNLYKPLLPSLQPWNIGRQAGIPRVL